MKKRNLIMALLLGTAVLFTGCSKSGDTSKNLTLGDYKDLTAERIISTITDDVLDYSIQEELDAYTEYVDILDRAAQNGDTVFIDFTGYLNGEEIEGGSEKDCEVIIGSGDFIDGFEEGIIGMKVGETKDVIAVFPEEYDGELDGAEATFKITLNTITETIAPEFNDEFVKEHTSYGSVEEYKASLRDQLQQQADEEASYMAAVDALAQVVDHSEVKEYPKDQLDAALKRMDEDAKMFAEQFGVSVEDLYGEDYNPEEDAKVMIKEKMVVNAIAQKENLTVTDAEYEEFASDSWIIYGYESKEEFDAENPKEDLMYQLLYEKVVTFLSTTCKFTDISEEEYYGRFEDYDFEDEDFEDDGMLYEDDDDFSDSPEIFDTMDLSDSPDILDFSDVEISEDEE